MNNTQWLIHTHLGSSGFFPPFQFVQPLINFRLRKTELPLNIITKKSHTEGKPGTKRLVLTLRCISRTTCLTTEKKKKEYVFWVGHVKIY